MFSFSAIGCLCNLYEFSVGDVFLFLTNLIMCVCDWCLPCEDLALLFNRASHYNHVVKNESRKKIMPFCYAKNATFILRNHGLCIMVRKPKS